MKQPNDGGNDDPDRILPAVLLGSGGESFELKDFNAIQEPISEPQNIAGQDSPRSKLKLSMVMIGLYLAMFVYSLDQTIIATAIPTITSDLHSAAGYAWIGSSYLLAAATSSPIWAKLSDIWGRKLIILLAIALFFTSSVICALSQNMNMLIAGRALQGTAGGGLSQIISITISDLFSVRERAIYMGTLEIVWVIAAASGPVIGGALSQSASWRYIFWINLPVCAIAFVTIWTFLDVHNPRTKLWEGIKAIDWFGSISIVAMTVMILLGLNFGGTTFPWTSAKVICLIVVGASIVLLFVFSEIRLAKYPLIPFELFRDKHNLACFCIELIIGFVFLSDVFFLPLYFQSVLGVNQTQSGLLVLSTSASSAIAGAIVGYLVNRIGKYREFVWLGLSIVVLGNGLLIILDQNTTIAEIIGLGILPGLGAGCLFAPGIIAVQANVEKKHTATATSTMFFCELISSAISLVVGEVVFQNSMDHQISKLRADHVSKHVVETLAGGNAAAHVDLVKHISNQHDKTLVQGAFADSLRKVWIMYTCVAACGLMISLFLKHNALSTQHTETKTGLKKDS